MNSLTSLKTSTKLTDNITKPQEEVTKCCNTEPNIKNCKCHSKVTSPFLKLWENVLQEITGLKTEGNLKEVINNDENNQCSDDIEWKLVSEALDLLSTLNKEINILQKQQIKSETNPKIPGINPNILGVNDEKTIHNIIELITALSVCPNLLEGIGLPMKSKFTDNTPRIKIIEERKLYYTIKCLTDVLENSILKNIVFTKIVNDLLATLVQLTYRPRKSLNSSPCCCNDNYQCFSCGNLDQAEVDWCRSTLDKLLSRTYQPLVIKQLLILQRGSPGGIRPKYKWFSKTVGELLSQRLLQENGVKSVINGILDGCDPDTLNWQKYQSISKVIAHVPKQASTPEAYYSVISKQILYFLSMDITKDDYHYIMISIGCVNEMLSLHSQLCLKLIILPMIKPLLNAKKLQDTALLCSYATLQDDEIVKLINSLHKICCTTSFEITDQLLWQLQKIFYPLFLLYTSTQLNSTVQKNEAKEILITILSKAQEQDVFSSIEVCIFGSNNRSARENCNVGFKLENGDVISFDWLSTENKIDSIITLLHDKKLETSRGNIFIHLLNLITQLVTKQQTKYQNEKVLLEIDNNINEIGYKIQLVSLISAIMDEFGQSVLQNTPQIVSFVKAIFTLKGNKENENYDIANIAQNDDTEAIDLALMLLSTLFGTGKLTSEDYTVLYDLVPSLDNIALQHGNPSSRTLANDLKIFISTHGVVKPKVNQQQNGNESKETDEDLSSESPYLSALKDLTDPLLPTRGHALIMLTKLLRHRNPYALKNHKSLLEIFECNVASDDTYLYLASIDGLIALTDKHHRTIIPLLCRKFAQFNSDGSNVQLSTELRMKLCEAIVKSCRGSGELLPMYTDVLLSSLLTGVRDHESSIRASSMSAVGDVCQLLSFSIDKFISELISCISHVVNTDESSEVRRASIQVFALLFKGIGDKLCETLPNEMLQIYRLLKQSYEHDPDDVTRCHADNALNILNELIKDNIMIGKPNLEKKIQVLM